MPKTIPTNKHDDSGQQTSNRNPQNIFVLVMGTIGLALCFGLTQIISTLIGPPTSLWWIHMGLALLCFVCLLIGAFVIWLSFNKSILKSPTLERIEKQIEQMEVNLRCLTENITTQSSQLIPQCQTQSQKFENKILPAFSPRYNSLTAEQPGVIESLQSGIAHLKSVIERLELIDEEVIFYESEPEKTLKGFICHPDLVDDLTVDIIRMVGTMRAICGEDTYSLVEHIREYSLMRSKKELSPGKKFTVLPFEEFRMVVPLNSQSHEEDRLYPMCARYFALSMLTDIRNIYAYNLPRSVKIRIRFNGTDCFPSWHMWGLNRFVIVPSIGYQDKGILAQAMPIGLVLCKN